MRKKPHNNNVNANVSCKICETFTIFFFIREKTGTYVFKVYLTICSTVRNDREKTGKKGKKSNDTTRQ